MVSVLKVLKSLLIPILEMSTGRDDHVVAGSKMAFSVCPAEAIDPFIGVGSM